MIFEVFSKLWNMALSVFYFPGFPPLEKTNRAQCIGYQLFHFLFGFTLAVLSEMKRGFKDTSNRVFPLIFIGNNLNPTNKFKHYPDFITA